MALSTSCNIQLPVKKSRPLNGIAPASGFSPQRPKFTHLPYETHDSWERAGARMHKIKSGFGTSSQVQGAALQFPWGTGRSSTGVPFHWVD